MTAWTQQPAVQKNAITYVFEGTVTDAPTNVSVHVIVRNPAGPGQPTPQGGGTDAWLVSPDADLLEGGRWKVTWTLSQPPQQARWTAVLVDDNVYPGSSDPCTEICSEPTHDLPHDGVHFDHVLDFDVINGAASSHKD